MFRVGIEQPITNNKSLYEKKVGAYELLLDCSAGRKVNRYSFVNDGGDINAISFLVSDLLSQINRKVFLVVAWLKSIPGKSLVASKVIEKKYVKQGWDVYSRDKYCLAIKEVSPSEIDSWPPLGVTSLESGFVIILSGGSQDKIVGSFNEESYSFLARARYFAPDSCFYEKLESGDFAALYQVKDDLNNLGVVLIGTIDINTSLIEHSSTLIKYEGDEAYKAFS